MMIILPDIPPQVRRAREQREIEQYEDMRQTIGVVCPKCGHKNLNNGAYSGGNRTTATHFCCGHCHILYAQVAEHRDIWDPVTWERSSEVVRMYVEREGDLDAVIRTAVAAHPARGASATGIVAAVVAEGFLEEYVRERVARLLRSGALVEPAPGLVRLAEGSA